MYVGISGFPNIDYARLVLEDGEQHDLPICCLYKLHTLLTCSHISPYTSLQAVNSL